jgi:hypothetical protein
LRKDLQRLAKLQGHAAPVLVNGESNGGAE